MESIGVIGIGNMGKGIAANLMKAGHPLTAFKMPTPTDEAAAAELQSLGARVTGALADVFGSVEILVLCVPNSQIVEKLLIGPGGLAEHRSTPVKLVLDFSTSHPDSTKRIAPVLEARGVEMLDTPMTGGTLDADRGTLRLIVGGRRSVFEEREGLLKNLAELVMYAGDHGAGNLVKLANNFLAILDQTATAGVSLVLDQNSIPRDVYIGFIGASSGNSGGFKLMTSTIQSGDFSLKFGLALAYKDIGYCRSVFDFPLADTLYELFRDADANGYHDKDVREIYSYLRSAQPLSRKEKAE